MSNTYYKATRTDGTDFRTGTIRYEVGKLVRPAKSEIRQICGPGYLHASDETGEVLAGGTWPCRLFEVTGRPHVGFDSQHRHKGGFRQLKVVAEIDPYLALGPRGRYVAGIIERSSKLTLNDFERLAASRDASRVTSRDASRVTSRDASRAASWDALRATSWDASWAASWDASRAASWDASRAASWAASWDASWAASRDASRAAVGAQSRDLITDEQYKLLTEVWESVMGTIKMAPKWKGPGYLWNGTKVPS